MYIEITDWVRDDNGTRRAFRAEWRPDIMSEDYYLSTNSSGDGIFLTSLITGDRKQLVGTMDFSICGMSVEAARNKIKRRYKDIEI